MRRLYFVVPLVVLLAILFSADDPAASTTTVVSGASASSAELNDEGRLVVLLIDSLRLTTLEADGVMSELLEFSRRDDSWLVPVHTCAANFTYPCLQTLFEGRQSPFVAGLHNFTGRASDADSVPAALERNGRNIAIASNISLVSLYGRHASHTLNVEDWPINHLQRDLQTFDVVHKWLDDDQVDDLFIHLLGTDKAAHHQLPGTDGYNEHFRLIDQKSGEFIEALDLTRDHLLITGDHGHDEAGHHTRDSIAILAGPRWTELFEVLQQPDELDQTELIYFMNLALGLDLPLQYEGRHFLIDENLNLNSSPMVAAYVEKTSALLSATGHDTTNLAAAVASHRSDRALQYERSLFYFLPLLFAFFFWLLVLHHLVREKTSEGTNIKRAWLLQAALAISCLITWKLAAPTLAVSLGLSAVYVTAIILWVKRFGELRFALWTALILATTALIGLHVKEWADFFHTRGGFVPAQPIFYTSLPLIGLALAWLRDADLKRAPEGAMAFCLFCLPSGVYYYQFGQNMFWGFLLAGALVTAALYGRFLRRERRIPPGILQLPYFIPAATLLGATVLLLLQESGGWEWSYFPAGWLRDWGAQTTLSIYAGLLLFVASRLPSWTHRILLVAYMTASPVVTVHIGAMPLFDFVAAHSVVLFIASWLLVSSSPLALVQKEGSEIRGGLVLLAAFLAMTWFMTGGFFIHNVDFHFAFEYFGHLQTDRDIFALVFVATLFKYGFPLGSLLLIYRLMRGADAFHRAMNWMLFFIALKMLSLFVQIFFAALGSTEKLYELAIAEVVFVFVLLVIMAGFSTMVALFDFARKTADRTPPGVY